MLLPKLRSKRKKGLALLETVAAVAMVGSFIAILVAMSSNLLGLLRTSKDNVSASQNLQQRAEQLRLLNWAGLTDSQRLADDILAFPTPSIEGISAPVETVTVSPYPAETGFVPAKAVRGNGAATVVSSNPALTSRLLVRVDVTLTWSGFPNKRNRARTTSFLVAHPGPPPKI